MLLRLRMDWRGGEHRKKNAQEESGGLSWERPDAFARACRTIRRTIRARNRSRN
jgi:hypothetical protein